MIVKYGDFQIKKNEEGLSFYLHGWEFNGTMHENLDGIKNVVKEMAKQVGLRIVEPRYINKENTTSANGSESNQSFPQLSDMGNLQQQPVGP
jgi:hypothetical protein